MRPRFIRLVLAAAVLSAVATAGCSQSPRPGVPTPRRTLPVSLTRVDTSAMSAEDASRVAEYTWRWSGSGVTPVRFNDVRSLIASAPWAIYPTQTFGRRLLAIYYVPGSAMKNPEPRGWNRYVDSVELVYEGGLEVEAAKHLENAVRTLTPVYYAMQQQQAPQGWGEATTVGVYPAISREATDGRGPGFGRPSSYAAGVQWLADDVYYGVQGGRGGRRLAIDPAWLPLDKVLAVARSAVRAPARVSADPSAVLDASTSALLQSRLAKGGKKLADNYEALPLFPNLMMPSDTLGRKLIAIVYDRVPPKHKAEVDASGRSPETTPWYARVTLLYEGGLTVTEAVDELTYEGLWTSARFSVNEYTTAFGVPGYVGQGRLEFILSDVLYSVDGPKLTRAELERVAHSMLP